MVTPRLGGHQIPIIGHLPRFDLWGTRDREPPHLLMGKAWFSLNFLLPAHQLGLSLIQYQTLWCAWRSMFHSYHGQHTEPCLREFIPTANQLLSYLTLPSPTAQNSSCLLSPKPKTSLANTHLSISMLCFKNQTPGILLFSCLFLFCKLFIGLWLPYGHLPSEEGSFHKKKHGWVWHLALHNTPQHTN